MAKYVGLKTGKVHESHVISEYYCGGCGYPVTDHDSFCPECGGAFCKCDADDLESENAKLRERVEWLDGECRKRMGASHKFFEMIGEYQKENAKLREFAEMFAKVAHEVGCDHCPYCDPDLCDEETDPMKDGCRLYEELRELGVTDD